MAHGDEREAGIICPGTFEVFEGVPVGDLMAR
jgi:hypothetical protein